MEVAAFIISLISLAISVVFGILTITQNRKLHAENKELSCKPNLDVQLLWDEKIGGQIIKKEYAFDSFNVWESSYTPFYVDGQVIIPPIENFNSKPLYTIFINNSGNGVAKNILTKQLKYINDHKVIKVIDCSQLIVKEVAVNQKVANKIICFVPKEEFNKIHITLQYEDINGKIYSIDYKYVDSKLNKNLVAY